MEKVYVCYTVFGKREKVGPYVWEEALREMRDISSYTGVSDCTFLIEGQTVESNLVHVPTFAERLDESFI